MKPLDASQLALVQAGKGNCGNWLETYVITQTCATAGGFIGLAGGVPGAYLGMFAGKVACSWMCQYAS